MPERILTISFPRDYRSVDLARAAILGICRELFAPYPERVMDFLLPVTEAFNNTVEHSEAPKVEAEVVLTAEEIRIRITTEGPEFDSTRPAAMPLADGEEDEFPEGGFGLALIQEFADRLSYEYRDGKNILTLVKYFQPEKESSRGDQDTGR